MRNKVISLLLAIGLLLACTAACGEEITIPQVKGVTQYEVPDNEAMAFVKEMKIGWNLGNTFDATSDTAVEDDLAIESYWCGITTTEATIEAVYQAGYKTLRLPVSWHNHVDEEFTINEAWLNRVQQVADWALQRGMYVILNTHHDVEAAYYYPSEEHYATSEKYITAIWSQLAERFKDYDEHLIFEGLNEPRPKGTNQEWWFNSTDPVCQEGAECINKLNQAFVSTVRASGGQNAQRYLMVTPYCASPEAAADTAWFRLPEDTAENKLIVSVHAYRPYSFALELPGTDTFAATNVSQYSEMITFMGSLYRTYVSQGIPVVIGEFGAVEKNANLQSRVDMYAYFVAAASARNIPCIVWDNCNFTGDGERFGLLDRKTCTWPEQSIVDAMMQYAGYDAIPQKK